MDYVSISTGLKLSEKQRVEFAKRRRPRARVECVAGIGEPWIEFHVTSFFFAQLPAKGPSTKCMLGTVASNNILELFNTKIVDDIVLDTENGNSTGDSMPFIHHNFRLRD